MSLTKEGGPLVARSPVLKGRKSSGCRRFLDGSVCLTLANFSRVLFLMPFGPDLIRGLTLVQSSCAFVHPAQGASPSHRILRTAQASHTRRWLMIQMPPGKLRICDHLNAKTLFGWFLVVLGDLGRYGQGEVNSGAKEAGMWQKSAR